MRVTTTYNGGGNGGVPLKYEYMNISGGTPASWTVNPAGTNNPEFDMASWSTGRYRIRVSDQYACSIEKDIEIESYNHDHNILNNIKNIKRDEKNDDLKKIKQWFKENGIDFSKKHEVKVLELLKNNSLDFVLKTFQEQLDILKNKSDVKSVAAVFSNHLFKGTCEVNFQELEKKETEHQKIKEEERKECEKNDSILNVFFELSLNEQEEIENTILKKHNISHFSQVKQKSKTMYYKLISSFIYEELKLKELI